MKISFEKVNFSYSQAPLFENLNLLISPGEHVWIRGRSGSGKSSLLKMMAGLIRPHSGVVRINDEQMQNASEAELKNFRKAHMAYVHQENHLIEHWTTEQNLFLVSSDSRRWIRLFEEFNLSMKILKQSVSELSGGEKQRVSLIRMLLQKPQLVLLDEPTAHLDDFNTEKLIKIIQEELKNVTLVIVSHDARFEKMGLNEVQMNELVK